MAADYLLGLTETKNDLADLHLCDEMIDLLKSGRIVRTGNTQGFCEAAGRHINLYGGYRCHADTKLECMGRCGGVKENSKYAFGG